MPARYDTLGVNYAQLRRPDPGIAARIHAGLGEAASVVNVGAGAGSYEPAGRRVVAVEPSGEMIRQRAVDAPPAVMGRAEALPLADNAFEGAMASLTVHHWSDQRRGLNEMRRVAAGPIAVLTFDPAFRGFWLADYLPALVTLDEEQMPPLTAFADALGPVEITPVPVPHDCVDGFLAAYWRRPSAYLDERVRAAISSFWAIGDVRAGLSRLAADLDSGAWADRYGDLMDLDACDMGYRLVATR